MQPVDQKIIDWGIVVEQFPFVPGSDLSGTVVEVGEGVTNLSKGDRIVANPLHLFGNQVQGAQEYAIAYADLAAVVPEGSKVSLEEAASIPCTFITAAVALTVNLGLKVPFPGAPKVTGADADEPILIWGAGSNVGTNAVFLLTRAGYKNVYAVAGARKESQLAKVGATKVFDYNNPSVVQDIKNDLEKNKLPTSFQKALDTISLPNSLEPAIALSSTSGGKIVTTMPPPESVKVPSGVTLEMTWAGIPYNLDGQHPEARQLGAGIAALITDLLAKGEFPLNPRIQVVKEADILAGFSKVLDEYRSNAPKGGKIVVAVP